MWLLHEPIHYTMLTSSSEPIRPVGGESLGTITLMTASNLRGWPFDTQWGLVFFLSKQPFFLVKKSPCGHIFVWESFVLGGWERT